MAPVGEPRQAPKPQPLGNLPFIILFMLCTLCAVFLLWRRASTLKAVVAHQLNTWTRKEGRIRLSEDDGPPAREFLDEDEYDEDNRRLVDRELEVIASAQPDVNGTASGGTASGVAEAESGMEGLIDHELPSASPLK
ncbi:hypothetical protein WOLCODRAFT_138210 [Wolfiporia cocos MD-104 SS10]|uniref:Uncharacterized protein n=1 Tax=Wolfiporia cocos (strain MD-104) TaxID=742152 RepID=A0A2H3K3Y5_WOLCO|nr:hypothetical protein WOLCODRAFT_138210 [Wolfiporia cocos MD-104 SS10]